MSSRLGVARVLALVALFMLWNQISDWLSDSLHADTFASPWKLPLILLGAVVTIGGIVGLGCVVWGKSSLRELGWRLDGGVVRLIALGLALTALAVGLVFCAYAYMGGVEGIRELALALRSIDASDRIFFLVMGAKVAFVEETLFRGDLLRSLRERVGPSAAVLASSVIFALYHRDLTPVPLVMKIIFAVIFALATLGARSLVPASIAHTLLWVIVGNN